MTQSEDVRDAAYQGQPGAYSEQAARRMCGADTTLLPCETLSEVFAAVGARRARCAIVPLENTLAGPVPGAMTLLLESGFVVHGEVAEPIDHVLAAPAGATLAGVREILSHPMALAQCERFFKAHPGVRPVPVFDTAGALQMVMRTGDPSRAAIVGQAAAVLYGASVLARHLQDHASNFTRFLRVAHPPAPPLGAGPCRFLFAVRLAHRPGTLALALRVLADHEINLTRIDSTPVPGCPFEYEFVLEGTMAQSASLGEAVQALERHARVRLLGSFRVAPDHSPGRRPDHQIDSALPTR
ncbi:MAG TPA: prephenate dehydratase domain-containing protein [Vicinamibacterales bacterium]|nr:prephenate dehydratase domain-containing protein [Vicinamibacterales bacterium]